MRSQLDSLVDRVLSSYPGLGVLSKEQCATISIELSSKCLLLQGL